MRPYPVGRALASMTLLSLCACAGGGTNLRPIVLPPRDCSLARLPDSISWRVHNPFRLVKSPDTDEQLRRYSYYLQEGHEVKPTPPPPETWWLPESEDYDPAYDLRPPTLDVEIRAPLHLNGQCQWVVNGVPGVPKACDQSEVVACSVTGGCTVGVKQPNAAGSAPVPVTIHPRNIVVATLGDSYASGEGVPDQRSGAIAGAYTFHDAHWIDQRCHRSLYSGHALSSLLYTVANPHVAVTYVSYACSGALLTRGLLGGYEGADPSDYEHPLEPQLTKLVRRLGGQPADYLTLSFGGNDVGFADIVSDAILHHDQGMLNTIARRVKSGIDSLDAPVDVVAAAEKQLGLAHHLALVLYPNPTVLFGRRPLGQSIGQLKTSLNECAGGVEGTVRLSPLVFAKLLSLTGREFDAVKVDALEALVASKLRDFGKKFADKVGAQPIENLPDGEFARHGFCAGGLTTDADNRWINTVRDSWRTQGTFVRDGTMHPNLRGQAAIGREILGWLVGQECDDHKSTESRVDDPELWQTMCDLNHWKQNPLLVQPANVDP